VKKLEKRLNDLKGVKVAIIGDILHSRVAGSNIHCLKMLGAEVTLCGPPTLMPKHIASMGVNVSYNLKETLEWCDVANILRIQLERQDIKFFPKSERIQFILWN
jgi:aspartate carbamoyltransferase catalytic subunit